jgi:hypothetical protein
MPRSQRSPYFMIRVLSVHGGDTKPVCQRYAIRWLGRDAAPLLGLCIQGCSSGPYGTSHTRLTSS